jgi:hypothetical protein
MICIAHRINTNQELCLLDKDTPIEFDVRDSGGELLVTHDPFSTGEPFEQFIALLGHRFCIVNIKSEGIEYAVLKLLKKYGIEKFFLLDCSVPMMVKLSHSGERRIAVRFSEYESIESVLAWKGKVDWVWVDCFQRYILTPEICRTLKDAGFKLCLVSPELQKRPEDIEPYSTYIRSSRCEVDAVCCKKNLFSIWIPANQDDTSPGETVLTA